ncbi:MAG: Bax inhibitor-1/YccA family protein [Hyphomicrobiaceae bacterium]
MAQYDRRYAAQAGTRVETHEVDEGLRSYMLSVYNYMAAGIGITGVVAYATHLLAQSSPAFQQIVQTGPFSLIFAFAPLAMVFYMSFRIHKMSVAAAQTSFWIYSALMGVSLSYLFYVYTQQSLTQVFLITAAMFGATSLWGYTTKRDLSSWGSFLIMGLIGVIIAMVVNLFLQSSAMMFALSIISVVIFTGLTAYDTQKLKNIYYAVEGDALAMGRSAIMGALNLYLDFVNIFLALLRLFGNRN